MVEGEDGWVKTSVVLYEGLVYTVYAVAYAGNVEYILIFPSLLPFINTRFFSLFREELGLIMQT